MAERSDLATQLYAALRDGDVATLGDLLHDDFVGTTTPGLPLGLGGTYHGPEAMQRDFWWRLGRSWRAEAVPSELVDLDDGRLLVRGTYVGSGRRSGLPLSAPFEHVLTFRDGRIAALEQLTDSAAWAAALGDVGPLETIDYRVADGVATVCLDRPEVRNAIDLRLAQEMLVVARRLQVGVDDGAVRAVLICGNGPSLTVGGDITYFAEHGLGEDADLGALLRTMTTPYHQAFGILDELDVPIVTAAHGSVAGGGIGFVYAADLSLVAEGTTFTTAFAALGLSGDGGGTYHLPRRIGAARAARVMLENAPITAEQAVAWGLVNELVPAEEVRERALALATRLAAGPTHAYARMRHLLRASWTNDLPTQLAAETDGLVETGRTDDAREAVTSFLAKRRPTFQGH